MPPTFTFNNPQCLFSSNSDMLEDHWVSPYDQLGTVLCNIANWCRNRVYLQWFPAMILCIVSICLIFCIFHSISEKCIIYQPEKNPFWNHFFAFFLSSVFISMYGFSQAFWLNLTTLLTFFDPRLIGCFKFFMCMTYFFIVQVGYKFFNFFNFHSFR